VCWNSSAGSSTSNSRSTLEETGVSVYYSIVIPAHAGFRLKLDSRPAGYEAILEPSVDDGVYFARETLYVGTDGVKPALIVTVGDTETSLHMERDSRPWREIANPGHRQFA
jgi:hypothetical protein